MTDHAGLSHPVLQSLDESHWSALEADDAFGWAHTFKILSLLTIATVIAPIGILFKQPWLTAIAFIGMGVQSYKCTFLMHDCSHNSLFKARIWNRRIGRLAGWLLGSDFDGFTRAHWSHHRTYGQPEDPQGPDYLNLREATRARLLWHLLRPLFGLNFLAKLSLFTNAGKKAAMPETEAVSPGNLPGLFISHCFVLVLVTAFGRVLWTAPLYYLSAMTIGLFLSQLRGFCEHVSAPEQANEKHVRTHSPTLAGRMFLCDINFNYHVEHHLFPSLAARHLPALHQALVTQNAFTTASLSPGYLQTILTRLKQADT